jgi:two-component system cell cycle sensor histidine kinase/response regulator CckA
MEHETRTTAQLLHELAELRERVAELEAVEASHQGALRALRESEQRYRGVFEGVQDAIFVESLSGDILDVNSRACEMFGYPHDLFLTKTVDDLVPPEHFALIPDELPDPTLPTAPIETVNIRADGERFPVEITGQVQTIGVESVLLVVVRDITERKRAEEALRQNERFLQAVFDAIQDGISILTPDLTIIRVNQWMEKMYAHRGPLTGRKCYQVYQLRASECPWCPSVRALETGEMQLAVVPYPSTEEPTGWIELTAFPLIDAEGDVVGVIESVKDITERRQAEASVRESEKRFRNLFDGMPACCWTFDREGVILDWNRAAQELYGWPQEQAIGKSMYDLMVKPENAAATREKIAAVFQGHSFQGLEYEDMRADGTACHVLVNEYPVFDAQGNVAMGICAEVDISERKRAEGERQRLLDGLREQVELTHRIVDTVPDGMLLLDRDNHVILANPAARDYLALLSSAGAGEPITRLGHRELGELLVPAPEPGRWHTVSAGTIPDQIFEVIARPMEEEAQAMGEDARPGGVVMVIRNVTAERDFQRRIQQQERLAAVGQLAAGVAHDFNNIMASIVLYSDMMLRYSDTSPEDRKRLETIRQQCRTAADITQQIMDFGRTAVLRRQDLDLVTFAERMHALLGRTLPENIHLHLVCSDKEIMVSADPTRLQQAIMNLAINARDAMPGGGHLHIALDRIQGQDHEEWARMIVADSGVGIPPDVLPHIFEPFFTTRAPLGSGLGLSQVYGIVKQHDGNIVVESHVGAGTTFTIDLPALQAPCPQPSSGEPGELMRGQGQTILVVEDNPAVRQALVDSLDALGYRTLEAENGRHALALFEEQEDQIALVVSDLIMPEMGGKALFRALKKRNPRIRMVMLTGHPDQASVTSPDTGATIRWLGKPVELESLARVVSQALETGD